MKCIFLEPSEQENEKETKELIKPYQCNICSHKFVNKGNLKRHILLIHSGKQNFYQGCEPIRNSNLHIT